MSKVPSSARMPLGVDDVSRPIFVVGCGRSGTTLLRLMLNRHPEIAMFGESSAFFRFGKYGPLDNHSELNRFVADWQLACERESPHPQMMASPDLQAKLSLASSYVQATSMVMEEFARLEGKRIWGEKTPAHVHRIPLIRAAYPKARFIHITRDPRPVVNSSIATLGDGRFTPTNIYNSAKYWVRSEAAAESAHEATPGQVLMVKYEQLVQEPEAVVRNVCDFLGVTFVPEMLSTAETASTYAPRGTASGEVMAHHQGLLEDVNTRALDRWRSELDPQMVGAIELAAGDWLQKRGYSPAPANLRSAPSPMQAAALQLRWLLSELRRKIYVLLLGVARRLGPVSDV